MENIINDKNYILFIDSGIGGLTILDNFLKIKNNVNIIYFADTINFPYGTKDELFISKVLYNAYLNLIKKYKIALITIVCNTASVSALKYLREHINNIQIIGTVPAIKPAGEITKNNRIGIIATETTARLNYIKNLIDNFADGKNVFIKASQALVEASENFYTGEKLKKILDDELSFFKEKKIDTLVLGCTHYSFLKDEIIKYFDNKVKVIDSVEGITNRILNLLPDKTETDSSKKILYLSEGGNKIKEKYEELNNKLKIFDTIIVEDLTCLKD